MLSVCPIEIAKIAYRDNIKMIVKVNVNKNWTVVIKHQTSNLSAIAVNKLTKKLLTANYYGIKRYHVLVTVVVMPIYLILYNKKESKKSKGV
jgi:hypothetical protein